MRTLLFLFAMLFMKMSFSQAERTYITGTKHLQYGQTLDLKEFLKEDKVYYTLEMDMKNFLTPQEVQSIEKRMREDAGTSFIVQDKMSNKITFFVRKSALRYIELIDYCKRVLVLCGSATAYTTYTETILEFVAD